MKLKLLLLGDRFITNDIFREALERRFSGSGVKFEYSAHQLQWPVAPMESNDEISEFSGTASASFRNGIISSSVPLNSDTSSFDSIGATGHCN